MIKGHNENCVCLQCATESPAQARKEISRLQSENAALRAIFPKILEAVGNGSGCVPEVSLEFLSGIPEEIRRALVSREVLEKCVEAITVFEVTDKDKRYEEICDEWRAFLLSALNAGRAELDRTK